MPICFILQFFRGSVVEENVVVGGGTCIGANSFVSHSVIGRNCKIGKCAPFCYLSLSIIAVIV